MAAAAVAAATLLSPRMWLLRLGPAAAVVVAAVAMLLLLLLLVLLVLVALALALALDVKSSPHSDCIALPLERPRAKRGKTCLARLRLPVPVRGLDCGVGQSTERWAGMRVVDTRGMCGCVCGSVVPGWIRPQARLDLIGQVPKAVAASCCAEQPRTRPERFQPGTGGP